MYSEYLYATFGTTTSMATATPELQSPAAAVRRLGFRTQVHCRIRCVSMSIDFVLLLLGAHHQPMVPLSNLFTVRSQAEAAALVVVHACQLPIAIARESDSPLLLRNDSSSTALPWWSVRNKIGGWLEFMRNYLIQLSCTRMVFSWQPSGSGYKVCLVILDLLDTF